MKWHFCKHFFQKYFKIFFKKKHYFTYILLIYFYLNCTESQLIYKYVEKKLYNSQDVYTIAQQIGHFFGGMICKSNHFLKYIYFEISKLIRALWLNQWKALLYKQTIGTQRSLQGTWKSQLCVLFVLCMFLWNNPYR